MDDGRWVHPDELEQFRRKQFKFNAEVALVLLVLVAVVTFHVVRHW